MAIREIPSPNFGVRRADVIDMLVLHYTGMESCGAALERLCDPLAEVSAHYLIDEDGTTHRLVAETKRAWHAGVASWRGVTDVNSHSIGIELVNPGHEFGYRAFPEPQITTLVSLCAQIMTRHPIPARNVIGHSDVAPARKSDPGELFPWAELAAHGIGLWPDEADHLESDQALLRDALAEIGYDVRDFSSAVKAFQRHWRPERVTGRIDPGTARMILGLIDLIRSEP